MAALSQVIDGANKFASEAVSQLSSRIPPPEGTWQSCCHMAEGVMQTAPAHSKIRNPSETSFEIEFGMLKNHPSSAYHWAHERGYAPQKLRAKSYFLHTVEHMQEVANIYFRT